MPTVKDLWDAGAPQAPAGFSTWGTQLSDGMGLRDIVVYTIDGTFDKGDFPWLRAVRVRVVGGGGAGGGAQAATLSAGGGGGAGGYAEDLIEVGSLAASETVTVGARGAGTTNADGGTGGTSSFGSLLSADGGAGGSNGDSSGDPERGGLGGGATGGTLRAGGQGGSPSSVGGTFAYGGTGGSSVLGSGAAAQSANADGQTGGSFGGGGSGGNNSGSTTARQGGDGGLGAVIVYLYG